MLLIFLFPLPRTDRTVSKNRPEIPAGRTQLFHMRSSVWLHTTVFQYTGKDRDSTAMGYNIKKQSLKEYRSSLGHLGYGDGL